MFNDAVIGKSRMSEFRIATWNISECVPAFWDLRKDVSKREYGSEIDDAFFGIIEMIQKFALDIVCFQEMPIRIRREPRLVETIRGKTPLKHHFEKATYMGFLMEDAEIGVGLFSRYPIEKAEFTFFQNPDIQFTNTAGRTYHTFDKGLITAVIALPDGCISVITGHGISFTPFGLNEMDFPGSFRAIGECIDRFDPQSDWLILTGDFNTEHLGELLPSLGNDLKDCLPSPTTVSGRMEGLDAGEGRKLDYFMVNRRIDVASVHKVSTFSDHLLCIFECRTI